MPFTGLSERHYRFDGAFFRMETGVDNTGQIPARTRVKTGSNACLASAGSYQNIDSPTDSAAIKKPRQAGFSEYLAAPCLARLRLTASGAA